MDVLRDPDLLSITEAATVLGIGRTAAYQLAARGELPGARKLGARWMVSRRLLDRHFHGDTATAEAGTHRPSAA